MKTLTVVFDPVARGISGSPGFLVSRKGGVLYVRLGGRGRLANMVDIPLFKGNTPPMEERDGGTYVDDAFPVMLQGGDCPVVSLAGPAKKAARDVRLVRFNLGPQRPSSARGTAWPEAGEPRLVAYACVGGGGDVAWPVWPSDSIWVMSRWDAVRVDAGGAEFVFRIDQGEKEACP